ncbi:hypothetical protein AQF52_1809 [Streptomyces venezuelae]|nr:hypothetical protein AQF52_1809 [Streptomyces venezuelae]CUM42277.1 hypothetical protein BN2537_13519 [Streptomyces venezuelae]
MRRLASFAVAAGVTRAVYEGLRRASGGHRSAGVPLSVGDLSSSGDLASGGLSPSGDPRWTRTNHAGRSVDLFAGPATAVGAAVGSGSGPVAFAVLAAAACGAYDDVKGDHRRGFRAHLAALRDGEVTSGAVKLLGIGAASLAAGALLKERPVDKVLAGVVIAGSAHLVSQPRGRTAGAGGPGRARARRSRAAPRFARRRPDGSRGGGTRRGPRGAHHAR